MQLDGWGYLPQLREHESSTIRLASSAVEVAQQGGEVGCRAAAVCVVERGEGGRGRETVEVEAMAEQEDAKAAVGVRGRLGALYCDEIDRAF